MNIVDLIIEKLSITNIYLTAVTMVITAIITYFFENIKIFVLHTINWIMLKKNECLFDKDVISTLEHGVPSINLKNIIIKDSGKCFHLSYNDDKEDEFLDEKDNIHTIVERIYNCFVLEKEKINIREFENKLQESRDEVKKNDDGLFDKEFIGIYKIHFCRIGEKEEPGFILEYYKTDYYTDRVMSRFYKKLKEEYDNNKKLNNKNKLMMLFKNNNREANNTTKIAIKKQNLNKLNYLLTSITIKPLIDFKDSSTLLISKAEHANNDLVWKLDSSKIDCFTDSEEFKRELETNASEFFGIENLSFDDANISEVYCLKNDLSFTISCLAHTNDKFMPNENKKTISIVYDSIKEITTFINDNREYISDLDYGSIMLFASKKGAKNVD